MFKIKENIHLSKNFKLSEFACRDGSGEVLFDYELIQKLQAMRDRLAKPIIVASGYRTEAYNNKVGGAPKSQHLLGKAADIKITGINPIDLAYVAESVGFRGIGVYTNNGNSFTHVDVRPTKSYWKDLKGGGLQSIKGLGELKK